MTDTQLYMAIGIPMLFNATLIGILLAYMNAIRDLLRAEMGKNQSELLIKFAELDHRIERLEQPRLKP